MKGLSEKYQTLPEKSKMMPEKYLKHKKNPQNTEDRGDKKPRNSPMHTMKNLPQFRDKSHEEVRQYILEKKGVDIGGNINACHVVIVVFIMLAEVTSPLWIEKLVNWYNKREERKNIAG